jgi:hypothetical protein
VSYADGSLPAVQEVVAAGSGVAASYRELNKVLAACKTFHLLERWTEGHWQYRSDVFPHRGKPFECLRH